MIRRKALAELDPWIERAKTSLVAAFANGITKDQAAVSAAISSGWSNGQAEGQICKLKLVKRQMYGRGKLDLLQASVVGATWSGRTARLSGNMTMNLQSFSL
jgi:transposase